MENSITDLGCKQAVFTVALGASMGMQAEDFDGLKLLSKEQIERILRRWKPPFAEDVL